MVEKLSNLGRAYSHIDCIGAISVFGIDLNEIWTNEIPIDVKPADLHKINSDHNAWLQF